MARVFEYIIYVIRQSLAFTSNLNQGSNILHTQTLTSDLFGLHMQIVCLFILTFLWFVQLPPWQVNNKYIILNSQFIIYRRAGNHLGKWSIKRHQIFLFVLFSWQLNTSSSTSTTNRKPSKVHTVLSMMRTQFCIVRLYPNLNLRYSIDGATEMCLG